MSKVSPSPSDVAGNAVPDSDGALDLLPRYLALVWIVLTIYGSLYPLSGWQQNGADPFAFLEWAWPRYWTVFDLVTNLIIYMPTGFLLTLALRRLPGRWSGVILAVLLSGLLSLGMESLQTWLPSRFSSNLDLGSNTLGALLGALIAFRAGDMLWRWWRFLRARLIAARPHVDLGLTLLGLWLMTLLSPETLLFGVGDLRQTLNWLPTLSYRPETYHVTETAVVVCNLLAVGLFAAAMTRGRWLAYLAVPLFFGLAALVRCLSAAILAGPEQFLAWLTPGVREGFCVGAIILAFALLLPPLGRLVLAALCLLAGAMLVNLAPIDPYSLDALALWRQGHFLNFNGLTRWISCIWPFLALPYLILASRRV
ncbi:MAG: VanZ family protein [Zoogloeaceae bacterium]|jgi:VanZ family protein|nr:VanZ family protein [Zoogloeaceae bacterium]